MLDRLVKRVGFLLTFFGLTVFVANWIMKGSPLAYEFNIITLICTLTIFVSSFFKYGRYVQFISLAFASLASIYDTPDDGVSFAILILTLLLMYKYKFFEKRATIKLSITFVVIILIVLLGSLKNKHISEPTDIIVPIMTVLFFIVFLTSLVIIMYDELTIYIKREKKYKKEIKNLNITIAQTQEYLKKIDANFIDPIQAGLTKKELILLEALCLYRESNIDLAERLGKSPNTIKVQLTRIMNKIGVETRYQLIDLCRHYFIEYKSESQLKV